MVRFITFEGGDGTGKTTQINRLEAHLRSRGYACVVTREPGGTRLGETIRKLLLQIGDRPVAETAEVFLYLADRAQHVAEVVAPALDRGLVVLCDRYTDSTLAYQGYGRAINLEFLREQNKIATGGLQPDLTLLLDCPIEEGLRRREQRETHEARTVEFGDRLEREQAEFHRKVRTGFLELARAEPKRFRIIDATRSIEKIASEIRQVVNHELTDEFR
jgi:dTMP kinase